jgi:DNA/RNA endonuclease YhcR with UshA esterase domain
MKLLAISFIVSLVSFVPIVVLAQQDQPTSKPVLIDVSDKAAVTAAMDKEVELEGVVSKAEWNAKGSVFFINFEKTDETKVLAVAFGKKRESLEKAFAGDLSKALTGAKIRVRGTLKDYKGKPEVVIDMPSQITILETAPATAPSTQPSDK